MFYEEMTAESLKQVAAAWEYIAAAWDAPIYSGDKWIAGDSIGPWMGIGLCQGVNMVRRLNMIGKPECACMHSEIAGMKDRDELGFKWGHTRRNATNRATFCRKQAKRVKALIEGR